MVVIMVAMIMFMMFVVMKFARMVMLQIIAMVVPWAVVGKSRRER